MDLLPLMPPIVSLKARVSMDEAMKLFRGGSLRTWFRACRGVQLRGVRVAYIPYRLFRVTILNRGQQQVSWLALDAFSAQLDLYQFDSLPEQSEMLRVETAAALPARYSADDMRPLLIERVRRQVYLRGFFRLQDLSICAESAAQEIYVPYMVGVYQKEGRVSIDVLDAVRRQREGRKVRDVIECALQERLFSI